MNTARVVLLLPHQTGDVVGDRSVALSVADKGTPACTSPSDPAPYDVLCPVARSPQPRVSHSPKALFTAVTVYEFIWLLLIVLFLFLR